MQREDGSPEIPLFRDGAANAAQNDLVLVHVRAATPRDRFGVGFAGIVEAVAKNVTAFRPGDAVYGSGDVAFGEYLCVPQHDIVSKPALLDFAAAALLARRTLP
jgi:NADPH:quinone reductase-like Zn-dependent oxidoreductase